MRIKIFVIALLVQLISFNTFAYPTYIDGIYYELSGSNAVVTYKDQNYNSYSGSVDIPEYVTLNGKTYSVTSIGNSAFSGCSGLTSVTIPNSVTSIESTTFRDCTSLTSITIGNSVTSIGVNAFSGCKGLTSINIPNSITSISEGAFEDCSSLTSVHVTDLAAWCKIQFGGCDSNPLYYAHHLYMNGKEIKELVIPDGVTSIGNDAFNNCTSLTSVIIGNGVTSIGDGAFWNCSGLTSVTIPNSVTSIEKEAFRYCSGLTSVTIPEGVTSIGFGAFDDCTSLTSVTIPESVTSIGGGAFSYCSGLTSVHITNLAAWCKIQFESNSSNPLYYAHHLYMNGKEIKELVIPDGATSIGQHAFYGCSSLTSITIPNSVTSIGQHAFSGCTSLTSITIGNSVTSIGNYAFYECSGLTSVTIPNSVTSIGYAAFQYCTSLTSVTIGNSVTCIGNYAFYECSGLTSVTIGNSVTSIGDYAFYYCSGLTSVTLNSNTLVSANRESFTSMKSVFGTQVKEYVIGNNVTGIGSYVFGDCSGLTSVTIPNSVTSIGYAAFQYCSGLTSVTIGNSVTSIGDYAFCVCSGLTSVTIPNSVTSIGDEAFRGCRGLNSITIPNSVISIGSSTFEGCDGLTSITIGNGVTSIGDYAFRRCDGLTSVTLNSNTLVSANRSSFTSMKSVFGTQVKEYVIGNNVTGIGSKAFYGCDGLTSVTIPNSVTSIGDEAFRRCTGLTSVTIPNSVTSIGNYAFYECSGLTSVTIPNSVTSIGDEAFRGCDGLTSITIPGSVTSIGVDTFYGCSGLSSVIIPNSVSSIGNEAFRRCTGLTSVTIPNSVTSIGNYAFYECSGLTSVTIGNSVTSIGSSAFANCQELTDVYCSAEQVPHTAYNAFENTPIQSAVLHVPTSSAKELYKTTAPWSGFGSIIAQTDEEIAGDGPQLENSSFDDWHVVGSGTQALYNPWKEGSVSFWDTGNRGATTVGASNSTYGTEDGRTYANLQSKFIVIKFAAGNIFTGSYLKTDGTNGILSLGRPFNSYPAKLQFDYTYKSSIVNKGGGKWDEKYSRYISQQTYDEMRGKPDSCCIWIALIGDKDEEEYEGVTYPFIIRTRPSTLKLFDPNSDNVIAYGQFTSGDDQTDWTTKTITLDYRQPDEDPKYIIVVATSSKYGDYFIGGDQSLLKLDNLKLLYNDSIPTERQTFFAEQANGVRMEFKVISKENQTCQVGSGTRPCVNTDISGDINIPNEAVGYKVVSIAENAFENCSGLMSITIPESVTSVGNYAFKDCTGLREIYCYAKETPQASLDVFNGVNTSEVLLVVPDEAVELYKAHSVWKKFMIEDVTGTSSLIVEDQNVDSIYDLCGYRVNKLQRGINIIRYSNGTTRKVIVK